MPRQRPANMQAVYRPAVASTSPSLGAAIVRWVLLVVLTGFLLQVVFALQIASLSWLGNPPSTSFQRSAIWQILRDGEDVQWQQKTVQAQKISDHIRRAVVASEDSQFFNHQGVDWQAIQKAWERNAEGERVLGGSTITQQLAKNLYLSSERSMLRKGQELLFAWMLEYTLSKDQILDIYVNQVEWGLGIYGIEAASRHYFDISAAQLNQEQAARLAVMLPQPKILGGNLRSAYMQRRTGTITQRARQIELAPNAANKEGP